MTPELLLLIVLPRLAGAVVGLGLPAAAPPVPSTPVGIAASHTPEHVALTYETRPRTPSGNRFRSQHIKIPRSTDYGHSETKLKEIISSTPMAKAAKYYESEVFPFDKHESGRAVSRVPPSARRWPVAAQFGVMLLAVFAVGLLGRYWARAFASRDLSNSHVDSQAIPMVLEMSTVNHLQVTSAAPVSSACPNHDRFAIASFAGDNKKETAWARLAVRLARWRTRLVALGGFAFALASSEPAWARATRKYATRAQESQARIWTAVSLGAVFCFAYFQSRKEDDGEEARIQAEVKRLVRLKKEFEAEAEVEAAGGMDDDSMAAALRAAQEKMAKDNEEDGAEEEDTEAPASSAGEEVEDSKTDEKVTEAEGDEDKEAESSKPEDGDDKL